MSDSDVEKQVFKVIVIGDTECGKTSLLIRFTLGIFLRDALTTIGVDIQTKTLTIDNQKVTLQLWDTAGQEKYRGCLVKHFYRNTDAIVFVYDVSNPRSFGSITKWLHEADQYCMPDCLKVLVGNKCDKIIVVPKRKAETFAKEYDMMLFQTSAKSCQHCDKVDSIFFYIATVLKDCKKTVSRADYNKLVITREKKTKNNSKKAKKCCT